MLVVMVVVAVMVNISMFCLYMQVGGRRGMVVSLDGVEGRLVQLVRWWVEEAGPRLCQDPRIFSVVKVDVAYSGGGRSVEMPGEGGREGGGPAPWELQQAGRVRS